MQDESLVALLGYRSALGKDGIGKQASLTVAIIKKHTSVSNDL